MKFLLLFFVTFSVFAKEYWVSINEVHPTQFNVGLYQVKEKITGIEEKYQKGELEKYLRKKMAPVVVGPGSQLYLVDHHHLTYTLYLSELPEKEKRLLVDEIENFSHFSRSAFWQEMIRRKWAYPNSLGRGPLDMNKIPRYVWQLLDDPFRTLAWMVQNAGGYEEVDVPFQEFYWADFFRNAGIEIRSEEDFEKVMSTALVMAKSKLAKDLPGFIGQKRKPHR